ncbi:Inner membrane protein YhcB [Halioglobus japonicus]|nr:Inner membrane protein YhcB [Halioglobus japonicus]
MESAVYSLEMVLAIAVIAVIVGLIAGLLMGRRSSDSAKKHRDIALKLDQVMQDKKSYEAEVVEHFSETAKLLNNLTESYREVHNQLAQGAEKLCHGAGPVSLERLENKYDPTEIPANLANIEPPLDYAPKTSPDEKGMLNEEFGLERKPASEDDTEAKGKAH